MKPGSPVDQTPPEVPPSEIRVLIRPKKKTKPMSDKPFIKLVIKESQVTRSLLSFSLKSCARSRRQGEDEDGKSDHFIDGSCFGVSDEDSPQKKCSVLEFLQHTQRVLLLIYGCVTSNTPPK